MLDLSYIIQDMTNTEINTTEPEFKVITDKKDEPDYKAVSKFVGGMVEVVQLPNGDLLLLNEEGKLMGLPLEFKINVSHISIIFTPATILLITSVLINVFFIKYIKIENAPKDTRNT